MTSSGPCFRAFPANLEHFQQNRFALLLEML
ncbi:hypothetical protein BSS2_I1247 [Brucella suis bv. 1 str. S2]|uniref:Uncharacterized protein n=1 Tax=Brucella suis biovar 1 (strain 1330) TaxID=204722 RepID=A0A0H3G7Z6_BRUSU|nr:hypothetical protein BR1280 [Brucella suis 1330]AEM18616.1 hypothetical protein BS1330_I1276 [Brucella suis 1330]AEU06284.1 hypothetical protein BSVBI22_A1276 [Brucella suis VBI22]AHN46902.1 hypothetical protein BSS2_I1247 [Brucella suis bv. 1 str. S2]CDL76671.1 unnamed protein product [Brucella canis str. Oliveri]